MPHDPARTLPPLNGPAEPFRPTGRPPIAILIVCDDGRRDGEVVRVRADRFVIGRTEGDCRIPHDPLISARHVEIVREQIAGEFAWVITDLGSVNGLLARITRTELRPGAEIVVGRGHYRFDAPPASLPPDPTGTRDGARTPPPEYSPALVELLPGGHGPRLVLSRGEYWIGADPGCDLARVTDRFCEPRHARLYRSAEGKWFAEHHKTPNGLWKRVPRLRVVRPTQFQLGEQRFRLIPG
jgi:hypothetical protein